MRFTSFFRDMFIAQSGVSSKRVCGVIGWVSTISWITYYVIVKKDMPGILETFMICTVMLLGIDTIPKSINAFKNNCNCKCEKEKKEDSETKQ